VILKEGVENKDETVKELQLTSDHFMLLLTECVEDLLTQQLSV